MDIDTFLDVLARLDTYSTKETPPVIDLAKSQGADGFKLLVGTVMSARTSDVTTEKALARLFSHVGGPQELAALTEGEIAEYIYPVGFYRTKARHIKELSRIVASRGEVPSTREELMKLPGVGRKTANLVLSVAFGDAAICVDTHVHRITNRLGFIRTRTPRETEDALMENVPEAWWSTINRVFVAHGQIQCRPVTPLCSTCPVNDSCERMDVTKSL